MANFKIKLSDKNSIRRGMGDIRTMLDNLETAAKGQAVETALFSAAKPMADTAGRLGFRDTSRLAASVRRVKLKPNRFGQIARVGIAARNFPGEKYAASRWHWEEFGFKRRKKPLQKFFEPAFDAEIDLVLRTFEAKLAQNFAKAIRGKQRISKSWKG